MVILSDLEVSALLSQAGQLAKGVSRWMQTALVESTNSAAKPVSGDSSSSSSIPKTIDSRWHAFACSTVNDSLRCPMVYSHCNGPLCLVCAEKIYNLILLSTLEFLQ